MKKCISSRQSGKTMKLMKLSAKNQVPIVVKDNKKIKMVKYVASKMNLDIPEPISIQQLTDQKYLNGIHEIPEVIIDDAEYVLEYLLKRKYKIGKISAISITTNDPTDELI